MRTGQIGDPGELIFQNMDKIFDIFWLYCVPMPYELNF